jgi:hypothetical protein
LARKKDTRWPTIFTIVYDEIFTAFEERWRFPLFLPPAEKVVGLAMKKLTYKRFIGKEEITEELRRGGTSPAGTSLARTSLAVQ